MKFSKLKNAYESWTPKTIPVKPRRITESLSGIPVKIGQVVAKSHTNTIARSTNYLSLFYYL